MNDDFKIGQLTKELVAMKLKELEDPSAVAAGLVKKTIVVALKAAAPDQARAIVVDACYGGMQGLLLAEGDLAAGAVKLLEAVCEAAQDLGLDPGEMMRYGLTGVARIEKFAQAETLSAIRFALENRFSGVGEAFTDALAAERKSDAQKV